MLDTWNNLLSGFATAGTPINLLWAFVGCVLGTAIGVLPGLGPAVTVAMLLPITAQVEPTASMIFFAGIYYGAMYGGSTTSILLNTPGETGTMVSRWPRMAAQDRHWLLQPLGLLWQALWPPSWSPCLPPWWLNLQ
jgi:TctA family transporter